jgi:hypothetical protein
MNEIPDPPPRAGKERFRFVATGRVLLRKTAAAGLVRFAGWWSLFAGALALNSVCPVCGNAGCPTGIGSFGLVAAVLAFFKQYGWKGLQAFSALFRRRLTVGSPNLSDECHIHGRCSCSCRDRDESGVERGNASKASPVV